MPLKPWNRVANLDVQANSNWKTGVIRYSRYMPQPTSAAQVEESHASAAPNRLARLIGISVDDARDLLVAAANFEWDDAREGSPWLGFVSDEVDEVPSVTPRSFLFDGRVLRPTLVTLGFADREWPSADALELPAHVTGFLDYLVRKVVDRCTEMI